MFLSLSFDRKASWQRSPAGSAPEAMANISLVEQKVLNSVRHTGAAEILANLNAGGTPAAPAAPTLPATGMHLPLPGTEGQEHQLTLCGPQPFGEPAAARSTRIAKTASKEPPGPHYPLDCSTRFLAYPLNKDGAGRVRTPTCPMLCLQHVPVLSPSTRAARAGSAPTSAPCQGSAVACFGSNPFITVGRWQSHDMAPMPYLQLVPIHSPPPPQQ